jgi:hypothetical protein
MKRDRRWSEKLNGIVTAAVKEFGIDPIDPTPLVDKALRGERAEKRNSLAKMETRREIGGKLRRWRSADTQPVFPGLLDSFAKMDKGYVRERHMPSGELQKRRTRYKKQGDGCFTKMNAIDRILQQRMERGA